MSFIDELKRRNVFRVAAAYAVVIWLIIQVVSALSTPLNLPEWFEAVVVTLLAIGFPIALLFAWAFDLTPDGIKITQFDDTPAKVGGGNKLDYALIGALSVVAAVTLWDQLPTASVNDLTQPASGGGNQSIAVLPFEDLSPEGDQAYFGNGIADELRIELQRLDGLRVAGRTSSNTSALIDESATAIGEILNVDSILEGSIRKDGGEIRITAQLISTDDGLTIWSDTYDRELVEVFAIQEEIATSVSGALGVRLGVGGVNSFKGAGTRNIEAYEAYLLGVGSERDGRIRLFERATQLDPNYSAAWSQLGLATLGSQWDSNPDKEEGAEIQERAYALVLRAVELDPNSAQSTSLLGTILTARNDWISAEAAHLRALSILSDRPNLTQYGNFLMRAGRSAAALEQWEKAEAVEPLRGWPVSFRVYVALAQGRFANAKEKSELFSVSRKNPINLIIALNAGDSEEIKAIMAAMPATAISTTALYSAVLSEFDSPELVLSTVRAVYADSDSRWPSKLHDIALIAAYFGDPEFALQTIREEMRIATVRLQSVWYPMMSEVRQLPKFKELMIELNLVDYWRASGWADPCQPLGDDDFECT